MRPPVPPIATIPLVHECSLGEGPRTLTLPESPYVLTVGATMGRKNLEASFEAMRVLQDPGVDVPTLVIAGAKRATPEKYLSSERMAPIQDKVIFCPNPPQSDLVALYENAVALIMASRMEGWGLPAGEALWCGTPAICANTPVLQEVCGDLGLYFDPDRPDELADHIIKLLQDHSFSEILRDQIAQARPTLRTWSHVAKDLPQVLADLPN